MKISYFILLLLMSTFGFAQKRTFEFYEGLCDYQCTYDAKKYTQQELQNTLDHLLFSTYISASATAWKINDIPNLSFADIQNECNDKLKSLNELSVVNSKFWEGVRQSRIREITEICELKKITVQAYENPKILMTFEKADSLSSYYRLALINGGDDLIAAWFQLNEFQKSQNGFPERLQQRFDEQLNSPLKLEYARLQVMMFGWWNHANHLIYHDTGENYFNEFKKLFLNIEEDCEY